MFAESLINKLIQRARKKNIPFVIVFQVGKEVKVEANCRVDKVHQLTTVALDHCKKELLKAQIAEQTTKAKNATQGD